MNLRGNLNLLQLLLLSVGVLLLLTNLLPLTLFDLLPQRLKNL